MEKLFRKRTAARKEKRAKQAIAPLPAVAPSLDIDIRNSLIMPSMTERFSVLLPTLSSAPEVSVRNLLEQQRARGQGPSLTKEEEELLMEEMRFAEEQQQLRSPQSATSAFSSPSIGAPSQRTVSAVSDWDGNPPPMEGDWNSIRFQSESSMKHSTSSRFGSSDGTMSPRMSPSNSGNFAQGNYSSLDEFVHERSKMQGRSYGFSGNTSFRDNNYLLKVHKSQSKSPVDDYHDGLSSPSSSLRPPLDDSDGASLGSRLSSRRPSNGSHRTVTPQPPQQRSPLPGSTSNDSLSNNRDKPSAQEEAPKEGAEPEEEMLAEEAEAEDEAFMSPLTRAASTIRRNPSVQSRKRQSMLIGMSPAQAKRISVALLEIESHLRRSTLIEVADINDGQHEDDDTEIEDREEMLEGESDTNEHAEHGEERRPSITSSSSVSSVFQYNASPISTHGPPSAAALSEKSLSNATSPSPHPATTNTVERESAIPDSPTLPLDFDGPPAALPTNHRDTFNSAIPSTLPINRGHQTTQSTSSTVYSEESDLASPRLPTLVPIRPQPARHTPSPALGATDYVPGQPRPVGSARQASISSRRTESIGSNGAFASSPQAGESPLSQFHPFIGNRHAQSRSVSQPQTSASTSRSQTPTQGRIDHVPAPGVLASRHQQSNSFGEISSWRAGSALAMYSPNRVISEAEEESSVPNGTAASSGAPPVHLERDDESRSLATDTLFSNPSRRTDSVMSYGSTYVGPSEDDSPWNAILKEKEVTPLPGDEQDRVDVDLLKSMSGVGKEELSLMQGALVEKARNDRDTLRPEPKSDISTPASVDSTKALAQPPHGDGQGLADKSAGTLSSSTSTPEIAQGHVPGIPPQPVSREQLPTGPPPPRPRHPSDATPIHSAPETPASAPGHDRSGSGGRKWLDDPPEAKRDIEERIANATSELFRAPSRNAHKRQMSKSAKKAISSPTLVSSSATVPTVPIAQEEKEKEKKKEKGFGGRKLSLRWKKKKPSLSGGMSPASPAASPSTPAYTPSPGGSRSAMPMSASSARSTPGQSKPSTPNVQQESKPNTPAASKNSDQPPVPIIDPPVPKQPTHRQGPSTDISSFRFPGASAPEESNGTSTRPAAERTRTMSQVVELSRKTHKPTGSEDTVAISRFFEAGRAIGLNDDQLREMLRQNNRASTARSYHSTAPTRTSFSHSASGSQSHSQSHSHSNSHSRSLSHSQQAGQPLSPTYGNGNSLARIPSPITESAQNRDGRPDSEVAPPAVLRRTLVVAEEEPVASGSSTSLQRTGSVTSPTDPNVKRGNSIRRKPIPLNSADRELIAKSPKSAHSRKFSSTSGVSGISEVIDPQQQRQAREDAGAQTPQSAGDRSSVGILNSSTQGSIYDYYSRDSASQRDSRVESTTGGGERASQAIEITEYSDGRVVWNILNALRDEPNVPHASDYDDGHRESLAESFASEDDNSRSSMNGNSQREDAPWRLGPTPALSFMRRPETKVYYTSSADVADLIDQLSTDVTGASRGRIDIRPLAYQTHPADHGADNASDNTEHLYTPSARARDVDPAQFADAPSPFQQQRIPGSNPAAEAHARFAAAMAAAGYGRPNFDGELGGGGLSPQRAYGNSVASHGLGTSDGGHMDSPSAASFGSDVSGANERSVEERLQALMDRLRSAPGGVGRGGAV